MLLMRHRSFRLLFMYINILLSCSDSKRCSIWWAPVTAICMFSKLFCTFYLPYGYVRFQLVVSQWKQLSFKRRKIFLACVPKNNPKSTKIDIYTERKWVHKWYSSFAQNLFRCSYCTYRKWHETIWKLHCNMMQIKKEYTPKLKLCKTIRNHHCTLCLGTISYLSLRHRLLSFS